MTSHLCCLAFKGAVVGYADFKIADSSQITVANFAGRYYLIVYATPKVRSFF